jgi:hypothetical protein
MTRNTLSKLIEASQQHVEDEPRNYIGASSIGSDCLRKIWYEFKGMEAEAVPTRMRRTWDIGKQLEKLIRDWLKNTGIFVSDWDVGFTYKDEVMPYFQGHIDGTIQIGIDEYILEIKTAKDSSFKIFEKKGVKEWNSQYYAQIQAYMGMSGIHSAYILVLNKDNSDISDELVEFDAYFYGKLKEKAAMIYNAHVEPPRINGSPLWFQCKTCKYNKVCHK